MKITNPFAVQFLGFMVTRLGVFLTPVVSALVSLVCLKLAGLHPVVAEELTKVNIPEVVGIIVTATTTAVYAWIIPMLTDGVKVVQEAANLTGANLKVDGLPLNKTLQAIDKATPLPIGDAIQSLKDSNTVSNKMFL